MESRYVLRPRPAVRAFALAALLAVGGAALAVVASQTGLPGALVVTGIVLIVLGVALLGLAAAASRRQEVTVILDDEGYQVVEQGGVRRGTWDVVTRVTGAPGRITLHLGPEERVILLVNPQRADELDAVGADIARRMDANRGYRNLP